MKWILVFFSISFFSISMSFGQNLDSHRWNDRLLILLAETPENKLFKKEYQTLLKVRKGLNERKLVIYLITPNRQKHSIPGLNWIASTRQFKALKKTDKTCEIILIGLDGGVKLRRDTFISAQQLFDVIDAMPMRASELRKN